MKKIRYIPYGYTMRNGRTVIAQEEAAVIREIFSSYSSGASLQSIADLLTVQKIPYSERTDVWDKARIARIISNAKYIGEGEYDPIIDEEQYEEAAAVKTARQRNTFKKNLEGINLLRDRVRCAACGAPMRRRVSNKHRIRESWECTNAGTIKTAVMDNQGISVISVRLVEEELRSGKLRVIRVPGGVWDRSFSLVYHRHKFLSEDMRHFIQAASSYEDSHILELLP